MSEHDRIKGQISITAVISIAASILVTSVGGYFVQVRRTDDRIGVVDIKVADQAVRVGVLDERTKTINESLKVINEKLDKLIQNGKK